MTNHRSKVEDYLAKANSEEFVLRFMAHPLRDSSERPRKDPAAIIDALSGRRAVILFNWFWTHQDVWEFYNAHGTKILADDVAWYVGMLARCVQLDSQKKIKASWVERINMFHAFGLLRLVDDRYAAEMLRRVFSFGAADGIIHDLVEMSGWNALSMLEGGDYPMPMLMALKSNPTVLTSFAEYQIYYYGGYENLLTTIKSYLSQDKRVMVPQSAAALLSWLNRCGARREIDQIYGELLDPLPEQVRVIVEQLGKSAQS